MTIRFDDADVHRAHPQNPCGTGVLVVAGSSGRVDAGRADLFARHGAEAVSVRWLGGAGQRPAPQEVPLETFSAALDLLPPECDRIAVVGTSFGAEAVLLTAVHDPRVDAVVGCAPSPVVWPGYDEERWSSHWTLDGAPLPWVPFVEDWTADTDPPAYRSMYAASLAAATADVVAAATIPVEQIRGEVVLVAGGDDQVWPSVDFARAVAERRTASGLATTVVTHPGAGHRTVLPGEDVVTGGTSMARGGTPEADVELGAQAWPAIASALGLRA